MNSFGFFLFWVEQHCHRVELRSNTFKQFPRLFRGRELQMIIILIIQMRMF